MRNCFIHKTYKAKRLPIQCPECLRIWVAKRPYLLNFFKVEIRNEDDGGTSPATLDSAMGSFMQAPIDVLQSWTKDTTLDRDNMEKELIAMIDRFGGGTLLGTLVK